MMFPNRMLWYVVCSYMTLAFFFLLYFFMSVWTYGIAVPSGLFIPSFFIGTYPRCIFTYQCTRPVVVVLCCVCAYVCMGSTLCATDSRRRSCFAYGQDSHPF